MKEYYNAHMTLVFDVITDMEEKPQKEERR